MELTRCLISHAHDCDLAYLYNTPAHQVCHQHATDTCNKRHKCQVDGDEPRVSIATDGLSMEVEPDYSVDPKPVIEAFSVTSQDNYDGFIQRYGLVLLVIVAVGFCLN